MEPNANLLALKMIEKNDAFGLKLQFRATEQRAKIKSNQMMVEKKPISRFIRNIFSDTLLYCVLIHENLPNKILFAPFICFCSICWPLSVEYEIRSVSKMDSLSLTFYSFVRFQCSSKNCESKQKSVFETVDFVDSNCWHQLNSIIEQLGNHKEANNKENSISCTLHSIDFFALFALPKRKKEMKPFLGFFFLFCCMNATFVSLDRSTFYSGGIGVNPLQLHSSHIDCLPCNNTTIEHFLGKYFVCIYEFIVGKIAVWCNCLNETISSKQRQTDYIK